MIASNSFGYHLGVFGRFHGYGATAPPTVKLGDRGPAVKALQKGLIDIGLGPLLAGAEKAVVTPAMHTDAGRAIAAAVRAMPLEQQYARYADGIFGPNTAEAVWAFKGGHFDSQADWAKVDPQAVVDAKVWAFLAQWRQGIIDEASGVTSGGDAPPTQSIVIVPSAGAATPGSDLIPPGLTTILSPLLTPHPPGAHPPAAGHKLPWGMIGGAAVALGAGAWLMFRRG